MGMESLSGPVIIGAGPGGIAAAIQLKRSGIDPLVYEKNTIGGLIRQANCVENYPGCIPFTSGIRMAEQMAAHFASLNISLIQEEVISVEYADSAFLLKSKSGLKRSRLLIVASGTRPRKLQDIFMDSRSSSRIYYDVNDISTTPGRDIIVVGGGDAAFDYALSLSRYHRVIVLARSPKLKCLPLLEKRVNESANITVHTQTVIRKMISRENSIEFQCTKGSEHVIFNGHCVLAAIGRDPELSFLNQSVLCVMSELKQKGQLKFVGDVANGSFRQLAITVGNGIESAMEIAEWKNREE